MRCNVASIFDLFKKIEKQTTLHGVPEYIIVGLGNPGKEYEHTRHNAGFSAIDFLCKELGIACTTVKFNALTCRCEIDGKQVLIMKPQTFMNLSGESVKKALDFFKTEPSKIIVFCDDINFDAGVMRIREKGSDAGQRGIRNITETIGTDAFARVRIGVGKKPHPDYDLKDWVLGKPTDKDLEGINKCASYSADICKFFVSGKLSDAMNKYNQKGTGKT